MNSARKKMLDRIRAMLNTEGRTEAEMMAFLAKARELMATYEIDENELKEEAEKASIYNTAAQDPYEIKFNLTKYVGKFTRCKVWADKNKVVKFCGLESDLIFATWLLDTLQRFVMRALRTYQQKRTIDKMPNSNHTSASFVQGCTVRIQEKLKELCPVEVTYNALVVAELAKNGIVLSKRRNSSKEVDLWAHKAGSNAGNSARFDRPVEQGGVRYLK